MILLLSIVIAVILGLSNSIAVILLFSIVIAVILGLSNSIAVILLLSIVIALTRHCYCFVLIAQLPFNCCSTGSCSALQLIAMQCN